MTAKTTLYRHYNANNDLLYVGVSLNALLRLTQHERSGASWFWDIARIEVQHFDNRGAALHAEAEAIQREAPIYNVKSSMPDPRFDADDAESNPYLGLKETKIRLTDEQRQRIEALAGKNRMAAFIREAIENELDRREANPAPKT